MTYEVRVSLIEVDEVGYSRVVAGRSMKCSSQDDARRLFERCMSPPESRSAAGVERLTVAPGVDDERGASERAGKNESDQEPG
jgi:hypothetical protein